MAGSHSHTVVADALSKAQHSPTPADTMPTGAAPAPANPPAVNDAKKDEKQKPALDSTESRRNLLASIMRHSKSDGSMSEELDYDSSDDEYDSDAEDKKADARPKQTLQKQHSKSDINLSRYKDESDTFAMVAKLIFRFEKTINTYIDESKKIAEQSKSEDPIRAEKRKIAERLRDQILEVKNALLSDDENTPLNGKIIAAILNLILAMKQHQELLESILPKSKTVFFGKKILGEAISTKLDYYFKGLFAYLGTFYSGDLGKKLKTLHDELTIICPEEAKLAVKAVAITSAEAAKKEMIPRLVNALNKRINAVEEKARADQKIELLTQKKVAILTILKTKVTPLESKAIQFDMNDEHPPLVIDYMHALLDAKDEHRKILDPVVKDSSTAYFGDTITGNVAWLVPGLLKFLGNYLYSGETSVIIEDALTEVIKLFPETHLAVLKVRPAEPKSPTSDNAKEMQAVGSNQGSGGVVVAAAASAAGVEQPKTPSPSKL